MWKFSTALGLPKDIMSLCFGIGGPRFFLRFAMKENLCFEQLRLNYLNNQQKSKKR